MCHPVEFIVTNSISSLLSPRGFLRIRICHTTFQQQLQTDLCELYLYHNVEYKTNTKGKQALYRIKVIPMLSSTSSLICLSHFLLLNFGFHFLSW